MRSRTFGFLIEKLPLQCSAGCGEVGLRGFRLGFGLMRALLQFRTAQLKYNVVRFNFCPGPDIYFLHTAFTVCRNPANVFGHERAKTTYLTHHWTAFYRINPES